MGVGDNQMGKHRISARYEKQTDAQRTEITQLSFGVRLQEEDSFSVLPVSRFWFRVSYTVAAGNKR